MHTRRVIRQGLAAPPCLAIGTAPLVLSLAGGPTSISLPALLLPALIVFAIHHLLLAVWERVAVRRVRRHVDASLISGDARSLRQAAAETAEAARDWPAGEIRVFWKALEITRRRVEREPGAAR